MLLALGLFTLSNIISMLTTNFTVLLIARILPAFLHPVYVSMAFTVAAASVSKEKAPKAVSKVFVGVSAGMVLGGSGDQLYCQRSFVLHGDVVFHCCKRIGSYSYYFVYSLHACKGKSILWCTTQCIEKKGDVVFNYCCYLNQWGYVRVLQLYVGLFENSDGSII